MATTSYPTSTPSSSPTYGPASSEIVALIEGSVIGGIFIVTIMYIIYGYLSYEWELVTYLKTVDESPDHIIDGTVVASDDDELDQADNAFDIENEERPLLKPRRGGVGAGTANTNSVGGSASGKSNTKATAGRTRSESGSSNR
jgi:hypothetical protein